MSQKTKTSTVFDIKVFFLNCDILDLITLLSYPYVSFPSLDALPTESQFYWKFDSPLNMEFRKS